jgi:hypothetical protein
MQYVLLSTKENKLAELTSVYDFDKKFKIVEFIYSGYDVWSEFCNDLRKYFPGLGRYSRSKKVDTSRLSDKFNLDESLIDCVERISSAGYVEYDYNTYGCVKIVLSRYQNKIIIDYQEGNDKYFSGDRAYRDVISRVANQNGYTTANLVEIP